MQNQILKGTSPGELESQLQSKFTTELQKTQPKGLTLVQALGGQEIGLF